MSVPISKREQRWAIVVALAVVAASCLPYLAAWLLAPDGTRYTGLLVNHYDGHSYYAKMQQGARGDWLFHLPFTPEPHQGVFVYTFYLALGQLSSALHMPIPLVYHAARAATGFLLLLVSYHFLARFLSRVPSRQITFLLIALSSGLGWLAGPLGVITADLWVAEGLTFLSILTNPHFPLIIALMLLGFMLVLDTQEGPPSVKRLSGAAALGLSLALLQPLAIPIVGAVLAVYLVVLAFHRRRLPWHQILTAALIGVGAVPVLLYDLYAYRTNPALAAWAAQNVTPSLPPWDYALGYGLLLLLAIPGAVAALQRRWPTDLFLLSWAAAVIVLLYLPIALQRRFITGFHVPLALLAAIGLERVLLPRLPQRSRTLASGVILAATTLTNILVPLVPVVAVAQGQPPLVIPEAQAAALDWLGDNTTWTDTVLAPPDVAHLVPAWAGNRVVYGHPFETIDADKKKAAAGAFFEPATASATRAEIVARYGVRYVLVTPAVSIPALLPGIELVWASGKVSIYRVEAVP
ncbi:MAG: hypothetical protein JXA93_00165 [Anaerolineae bacterium]|nr:hypothetical protein [Anaerolineae bacterium]